MSLCDDAFVFIFPCPLTIVLTRIQPRVLSPCFPEQPWGFGLTPCGLLRGAKRLSVENLEFWLGKTLLRAASLL